MLILKFKLVNSIWSVVAILVIFW